MMKNYLKTSKWLRWMVAGVFGLMLMLNVMVSLEFEKDKVLPSLTLKELGNMAFAQSDECEYRLLGQDSNGNYCCLSTCNYLNSCSASSDCRN
ncbi:hypothetical protein [Negadavirga shengliensis]|uniref:Uncharacterized protein n=1 Tax=Negadavirga shengliensis TaxID=1389218 RepID=A0ABV9SXW1_9BACT